ncbi:sigma-54 interaction domain-containing protein [Desulfoluna spongiiphila]|uniref:sigma-54 interaction domain-containing protein n=1 Tax=Desulfoluna spongiiphila TaxID=419481 RepID=UPI00125F8CF1|nr:sigma 54-interacting transcriptional regulator [Desulfoluna spongiiphila]
MISHDTLMRNLPGMVYRRVNDDNWSIDYVSEGARKLFGETPYQMILTRRAKLANLVHEACVDEVIRASEQAMAGHKPYQLIYRVNSLTERDKWVWDRGEGIYNDAGSLIAAEGFITDFTEHKEMEEELREEIRRLKDQVALKTGFHAMTGASPAMQELYAMIEKAAETTAPVIVNGESGTGKELVSRTIHDIGPRKEKNFVPVNCGAIPENLMESEFFGHCKGAFSGAHSDREGLLDKADGGTLFLDEIGEIGLSMQTKLLRAIEGGGYTPVGGRQVKVPDIRIVSATNRDLAELVRRGKMREDFFYRIHVVPITVPPLRERRADIPLLVDRFIKAWPGGTKPGPSEMSAIMAYDWPGNIRELENVLRRYATLGRLDLPTACRAPANCPGMERGPLKARLAALEKQMIEKALKDHNHNRTRAASELAIDRRSLYTKIKAYNISPGE